MAAACSSYSRGQYAKIDTPAKLFLIFFYFSSASRFARKRRSGSRDAKANALS